MKNNKPDFLTGQLLLSMPSLEDDRFNKAVILVCAHDDKGAMGLVLNHKMDNVTFSDLLSQLDIQTNISQNVPELKVMKGGPVEQARGFLLHPKGLEENDTIEVSDNYLVSGSVDVLKKLMTNDTPDKIIFLLGYSGWGPGQLDSEIQSNAWLTIDPDPELVYKTKPEEMWDKAIRKIGIDPSMLSANAGRA